jgi:gluconolactonase
LRELPYSGFYLLKDGNLTLLGGDRDKPGEAPNGIALSPDDKMLYVTAGGRKTLAYDVLPDDTVANPRTFIEAGKDGIKTDNQGNVYQVNAAGQGEVLITAANGKRLGTIQLPQIPGEPRARVCASNIAFGDADGKTLYITSCTHLFRVRLKASGRR